MAMLFFNSKKLSAGVCHLSFCNRRNSSSCRVFSVAVSASSRSLRRSILPDVWALHANMERPSSERPNICYLYKEVDASRRVEGRPLIPMLAGLLIDVEGSKN